MSKSIQSIERAAAVLRLLARGPGRLGVVELAGSLGLPKGTVHGILRTLAHVGFVEQDGITGKYQLGAALLHLGTSYLDVNELRSRAINWADALASRSGEAVRIGTLLDGRALVVHHVFRPDDSLQTVEIGLLLPPHACAIGKVLLAYDGTAASAAKGTLEPYTRRTLSTPRGPDPGARADSGARVGQRGRGDERRRRRGGRTDPRARRPGGRLHRHHRCDGPALRPAAACRSRTWSARSGTRPARCPASWARNDGDHGRDRRSGEAPR